MRVAVVVKTTQGALWIIPQVEALLERGADVTVITPAGDGRLVRALAPLVAQHDRLSLRQLSWDFTFKPRLRTCQGIASLRTLLKSLHVEVCLYHLYATALAVRLASLGTRVRKVHMVAGPLYLASPIIRTVERLLVRRDDHVIAGSEYTRRAYLAIGTRPNRISMVPYGVDVERFRPPSEDTRASRAVLGLSSDAFVAVMVAFVYSPKRLTFSNRGIKGHYELLRAWQRFQALHPEARLVLVGGGFDAAGEALRRDLIEGVGQPLDAIGVTWLDSVEDVREVYGAGDVSISPSLSENHGAALEASAMGLPSIVSNAGGLPEAVTPASGWIVPAGSVDELVAALESAHSDWRGGVLPARGRAARALMLERFDVRTAAARVADTVFGVAR